MQETIVIFRKYKGCGGIIALMPEIPASSISWYECESYEHVGQHGAARMDIVIPRTMPATPDEYADLKAELEATPYCYKFRVMQRETPQMRKRRGDEWSRTIKGDSDG